MTNKRKQNPPTVAMRLSDADKSALRQLSERLGKSQTETVRVLVRTAWQSMNRLTSR